MRLTKALVERAGTVGKDTVLWDRDLRGFGLKLTKGGGKIYVLQYRMGGRDHKTRRYTIGKHSDPWTTPDARREAERLMILVKTGQDPQSAKRDKQRADIDLAFTAYVERFLEDYGRREWKQKTFISASSAMRRWLSGTIGGKTLLDIRRRDITEVLDRIPSNSLALKRSVFAYVRKLLAWAVERGDLERSPLSGMKGPAAVKSRERTLDDDELCRVLAASMGMPHPFGDFTRLLLLTGQRRDEVAGMRWEELDRDAAKWRLPGARTKNSLDHTVPLSTIAIRELDDLAGDERWPSTGFVLTTTGRSPISGFSKMKRRLDRELAGLRPPRDVAEWRLHDLRRSMATSFQRLGIRFEVTEAMLNHVSGAKSGVAGIYQRYDWAAEKAAAAQLWADHLWDLVENARQKLSEQAARAAPAGA